MTVAVTVAWPPAVSAPTFRLLKEKRGVGQAVAEREQRRQALGVVPAVADVDALGVLHRAVRAGPLRGRARRDLGQRGRERHRQVAGRVGVAEQQGAIAVPSSWPGYQASSTPLTEESHGMVTADRC